MFTLEDLDLGADLQDLRDSLDADHAPWDGHDSTMADADARLHPRDYFIAGV